MTGAFSSCLVAEELEGSSSSAFPTPSSTDSTSRPFAPSPGMVDAGIEGDRSWPSGPAAFLAIVPQAGVPMLIAECGDDDAGYRGPAIEAPETCSRIAAVEESGTLGSFPLNRGVKRAYQVGPVAARQ